MWQSLGCFCEVAECACVIPRMAVPVRACVSVLVNVRPIWRGRTPIREGVAAVSPPRLAYTYTPSGAVSARQPPSRSVAGLASPNRSRLAPLVEFVAAFRRRTPLEVVATPRLPHPRGCFSLASRLRAATEKLAKFHSRTPTRDSNSQQKNQPNSARGAMHGAVRGRSRADCAAYGSGSKMRRRKRSFRREGAEGTAKPRASARVAPNRAVGWEARTRTGTGICTRRKQHSKDIQGSATLPLKKHVHALVL